MRRATRNEFRALALAMQFLTRLPIPACESTTSDDLAHSVCYHPLVGALIGGLCAAAFWIASLLLPVAVAVPFAMAVGLLLTGALHEDGLADTFDGIGASSAKAAPQETANDIDLSSPAHQNDNAPRLDNKGDTRNDGTSELAGQTTVPSRAFVLTVMRDSRLGTFGATALILALGLKAAALVSLEPLVVCIALITAGGLSRLSCIAVMQTSNYIRFEGAATPLARGLAPVGWFVVLVSGLALIGMLFWLLAPPTAGLAIVGLALGHALMRLAYERKLRGYTGDTLGAVQQTGEIGLYLGMCAGGAA